jgi:hypothetical protein
MPISFKRNIIKLLEKAGFYQPHRFVPVDFRGILDDPVQALKRSAGRPALINFPLNSCRSMLPVAFPCTKTSGHPLIETAMGILDGTVIGYIGSPLQNYYQRFQPANLSQLMGLGSMDDGPASKLSPYAFIFPWGGTPSVKLMRNKIVLISKENRAHHAKLAGKHGWLTCGPIAAEKGMLEYARQVKTLHSIQKHGYQRDNGMDGDLCGTVLVNGNDCVLGISPGQHRIAALVALGYDVAPVRIGHTKIPIIYRTAVDSWPSVKNGFYSVKQALEIFDRVFEGRQPFKNNIS